MNDNIEENTTSLSLIDLWRMIWRNIYSIIYFTILGLILGIVYTNLIVTPEYTATGYVAMKATTSATVLNTITEIAKSRTVADAAVITLDEDGITHPNGDPIVASDIIAGVTASYTATSLRVTISYKNEIQAITVPILNAVIDATITTGNTNYTAIANNLILDSYAEVASYTGPSSSLYIAIFVILGGVVGTGLGIVTDIIEDRIHHPSEIQSLGVNAFSVCYPDNKKKEKRKDPMLLTIKDLDVVDTSDIGSTYYHDVLKLQNDIENFTPDKQVKTIGCTSTKEYQSKASLIASMAEVYAKEHQRVLVLDFDFEHPFMHELFQLKQDKNIVSYYLSFKPKEEFYERVNPYLVVIPGSSSAIGSKIIKSERLKKLVDEARKEFDYVLINCPPTLKDMTILSCASLLDGVLVMGKFHVTKKKEFIKTASIVSNHEMHLIGGAFLSPQNERNNVLTNLFSKLSR